MQWGSLGNCKKHNKTGNNLEKDVNNMKTYKGKSLFNLITKLVLFTMEITKSFERISFFFVSPERLKILIFKYNFYI